MTVFLVCLASARPGRGRAEAMKFFRPAIDDPEVDVGETNDPVAAVGLGDADGFALQRFADEDQVAAPLDGPVGAHPAHGVPGIVPGLVQAFGVRPQRGPVERRRRLLAKRLVGTVVVEVLAEAVEAGLLPARARGRRLGSLGLQGPMHALVPPVLLGLAGLDTLQRDAGLDPADRQARQPARARSGERCPVVRADGPEAGRSA